MTAKNTNQEQNVTRQIKTPKQRAEEQLAVANRKAVALERKADQLKVDLVTAERDLAEALALRDHAKTHPALKQSTTPPQEEGTKP